MDFLSYKIIVGTKNKKLFFEMFCISCFQKIVVA